MTRGIEILYFEGCPNYRATLDLVRELAGGNDVELVEVGPDDVEAARFLGSPSVRVNGRDVEPGADDRADYAFACRVYRRDEGLRGLPDPRWVAAALAAD
ncbi:MAG: hypothetical protein WD689_01170 [Gaiellaceae bacterium]